MALAPNEVDQHENARGQMQVEAHRRGDPDAFPSIVRDHYRALLSQAERRLGSRTEAEDAVQEVFERAFRAIDRFGGEYRLAAWLSLITSNVCVNHGTRRSTQRHLTEALGLRVLPAADDPSDSISDPKVLAAVRSAIDALPLRQRDTFVLHEVSGLSYSQVADRLGISEANARARVHRAKATLRRNLEGVRNALGGFVALPVSARGLTQRWSVPFFARNGGSTDPSTRVPGAPTIGTDVLPITTPSLSIHASSAQSIAGFQQAVGQVASTPLGQLVLAAVPSAPRGSLLAALAASVAAVTTATFAAPGVATEPAAAAPRVVAASVTAAPASLLTALTPANSGVVLNPISAVVSPSTSPNQSAIAPSTSTGAPSSPRWISTASGSSRGPGDGVVGTDPSGTGTTLAGGASESPIVPAASTTGGTESAPGTALPTGTGACPWLTNFSGGGPGRVASPAPISGSPTQVLGTSEVNLTNVWTNPVVATSALLTSTAVPSPSMEVKILAGACLDTAPGVLIADLTGPDGTEVQLRGWMVMTTGDASVAGYLFRGTVVNLSHADPNAPISSTSPPPDLPWGLPGNFVAQLIIRQAANTAELSLAFLAEASPPSSAAASPPSSSTASPPSSSTASPPSSSTASPPSSSTASPPSGDAASKQSASATDPSSGSGSRASSSTSRDSPESGSGASNDPGPDAPAKSTTSTPTAP